MHQRFISLAILLTFVLAAGCSTAAPSTPVTASPTAIPGVNLTVMAAASLTESFTEIGSLFEAQHPGVKVAFNFAGSQQLVEQLTQGADADVFASASMKYMKSAIDAGLVKATESQIFARNLLVVIYPAGTRQGLPLYRIWPNPASNWFWQLRRCRWDNTQWNFWTKRSWTPLLVLPTKMLCSRMWFRMRIMSRRC